MLPSIRWPAVLCVTLLSGGAAWGQAGRFVPMPRLPSGSGARLVPFFHLIGGSDWVLWIALAVIAVSVAAVIGWNIGQAVGRRRYGASSPRQSAGQAASPESPCVYHVPPTADLILSPTDVAEKAQKTMTLLGFLACRDRAFDVAAMRDFVAATFKRVQQCWEERDYEPVKTLLLPQILKKHTALLRSMRQEREINRIENLDLQRLEFVHVFCPETVDEQEVTALLTFSAKVYFVDDRTLTYRRGSLTDSLFQEFWIFRRQSDSWRLQGIEMSDKSDRLNKENHV
jgi:predicted lipid-binding transport protein (Tim44 family)